MSNTGFPVLHARRVTPHSNPAWDAGRGRLSYTQARPYLVAALCAAALLLLAACAPARHYQSALVLQDLAAADQPSRLKRVTPVPRREVVRYRVDGRARVADLYLPGPLEACRSREAPPDANCPRAALIAVPGAVPLGNGDPRFTAFAATLARAGFAVLAPEMPGFRSLRVRPQDAREIADALRYALSRPELAPEGRAGVFAFSYAAGPAILAALEDDVRERVRFIATLGGYYDLPRAMRFFTTGWYEHAGISHHIVPDDTGRMVLAFSSLDYLDNPADEILFEQMVWARQQDPAADLAPLAARLSEPGQAVYALATNTDPARFAALLARLPAAMRADIERLNLASHDLSPLRAPLWLVHGKHDNLIPWTESLALARAVPPGMAEVFLIQRAVDHVALAAFDPLSGRFWTEDLPDLWRLWRVIDRILAVRAP